MGNREKWTLGTVHFLCDGLRLVEFGRGVQGQNDIKGGGRGSTQNKSKKKGRVGEQNSEIKKLEKSWCNIWRGEKSSQKNSFKGVLSH